MTTLTLKNRKGNKIANVWIDTPLFTPKSFNYASFEYRNFIISPLRVTKITTVCLFVVIDDYHSPIHQHSFTHFPYPYIFSLFLSSHFLANIKKQVSGENFENFHITDTNYTHTTSIVKIRRERDGSETISLVKPLFIIHSLSYLFLLYNYNTVFLF